MSFLIMGIILTLIVISISLNTIASSLVSIEVRLSELGQEIRHSRHTKNKVEK